jgi:RNA recognition motif-containing protein
MANIRMKTTTVLIDDVRVSWFNVNCVHVKKVQDGYIFTIFWKYKAAVKEEKIFTSMNEPELPKYFAKYGLIKFQNWYVNLSKIMIIKENIIYGPQEKTRVNIIFSDGYNITKTLIARDWSWWKQTYA